MTGYTFDPSGYEKKVKSIVMSHLFGFMFIYAICIFLGILVSNMISIKVNFLVIKQ